MSVITLTSDLGLRDHYVASIKGTLLTKAPQATVVDVSHEIAPFNTLEAAYVLRSCYQKFPSGTIHLVAIDPESRSAGNCVIMKLENQVFVGPDNGVLSLVAGASENQTYRVNSTDLMINKAGLSFFSQNLYAPIAAFLANGGEVREIAEESPIRESFWGDPSYDGRTMRGVVIHIDHFGNVITNIQKPYFLEAKGDRSFQIFIRKHRFVRIVNSYADVGKGDACAIFADNSHMEISIREGSASQLLGLNVQDMLTIEFQG